MGVWISLGSLLTLLFIVIILIIKESIKLRNTILYNKHIEQNLEVVPHSNFTKLPLEVVDVDYRIPKGQWAHFTYDIPNLSQCESKRKYVGNTLSGIKLPFVNLSVQNKELKDTTDFANRGPARITLTNKLLRVQTQDSNISLKKEIKWSNIEQVRFVLDNKTVQVNPIQGMWPLRFSFENTEQAMEFSNAIWTLVDRYSYIDLNEVGKMPEQNSSKDSKVNTTFEIIYQHDEELGVVSRQTLSIEELKNLINFSGELDFDNITKLTKKKIIELSFVDEEISDIKPLTKQELIKLILDHKGVDK